MYSYTHTQTSVLNFFLTVNVYFCIWTVWNLKYWCVCNKIFGWWNSCFSLWRTPRSLPPVSVWCPGRIRFHRWYTVTLCLCTHQLSTGVVYIILWLCHCIIYIVYISLWPRLFLPCEALICVRSVLSSSIVSTTVALILFSQVLIPIRWLHI